MTVPERTDRSSRLLSDGRKLAGFASAVLLVSLFLPWYQKSVVPEGAKTFATDNLSAFGSFTWIEAALILVVGAVITLLWLRHTDRRVELPVGDGTMIAVAGGWIMLLLLVRVFDKPSVTGGGAGASVGLQWGLLVAMAAGGALLAAGLAMRAVEHSTALVDEPTEPTDVVPGPTPATVADDWADRRQ